MAVKTAAAHSSLAKGSSLQPVLHLQESVAA
jgi:hypothetical protein